MINKIQNEIIRLKKETDTAILAHSYVAKEILEIADYTGDSYKLSVDAKKAPQKNLLVCGVHFMAETAKMLSPQKKVFLANSEAGCPMAEQMSPDYIQSIKEKEPDRTVVAYVNTTAELKAVCDVCVTSSTALKIVENIENDKILFIPDCNLGNHVKIHVKNKDIMLLQGGCPVHSAVTPKELENAKNQHPDALVLVHPECIPEVTEKADYAGSTSGIIDFALKSDAKEFIIGTEISIAEYLQYKCPEKNFYPLSKKLICPDMKIITLNDVYNSLKYPDRAFEIKMTDEQIEKSSKCIDEMIRLGG